MDTAITILVFGIVALSAAVCVLALISFSGSGRRPPSEVDATGAQRPDQATPGEEAWIEARALADVRNARRRRHGEPERDRDDEAAEILRGIEDG